MRILHTGDWHMNDRLGRVPRANDIVRSLEQIASYLESENVDVMIVAGDLFCDKSSKEDLGTAIRQIERIFGPFLGRGGTIVAISGNHDSEIFFSMLRDALRLAPTPLHATAALVPGVQASGRLHLFPRASTLKLAGPNGEIVQFALMPYPNASFLRFTDSISVGDEPAAGARLLEEQHLSKQGLFTRYLNEKIVPSLDIALPTVLVSHILVSGITTRAGYRLSIEDDVAFSPSDIPTGWAYVAYGHIHAPQTALPNASHIRYCGSIERLDFGEADDEKSVVIVDIGANGLVGQPRLLPLPNVSPFLSLVLGSAEGCPPEPDIVALESSWQGRPESERERLLVRYTLYYRYITDRLDDLRQRLHALFPRIYDPKLIPVRIGEDGLVERVADSQIDLSDVRSNAVGYVEKVLPATTTNRSAILEALNSLLGADNHSSMSATVVSSIETALEVTA